LADESGTIFDTVGSMRGGADVFVTMKVPEAMLIRGVDRIEINIVLLNNHTGSRAITGLLTSTRVVCANTQRAALRNAESSFKFRHTESASERVQEAREKLGLTFKYMEEFQAEANKMLETAMAIDAFRKVCGEIWTPLPDTATNRSKTIAANRKSSLDKLFLHADTNVNIRGTRWAAYQSITEYLDHGGPVKGTTSAAKAINRAVRSIDGTVVETKQRAFAVLSV
jgi:phage/plasmid-like protein (TIGR03299 family)